MKMSVGDVLLHPWHMDADILNEVGNIPGLQTGLSPNCSLQAAYNIVYTSPLPPYTTLSLSVDSMYLILEKEIAV